jgi:hypothetical protein
MATALKVPNDFTSTLQSLHIALRTKRITSSKWQNGWHVKTQEACHRFATYLQWTVPGYHAKLRAVSKSKDDEDDEDEEKEAEADEDDFEQVNSIGYSVAKVPAYAHVPIISILSDFGAADFLPSLENFLRMSPHTSRSAPKLLPNTVLSLYKCMIVRLPPASLVSKLETKDVIRARRAIPAHGKILAVPCQFDTVLARESDDVDRLTASVGRYVTGFILFLNCSII